MATAGDVNLEKVAKKEKTGYRDMPWYPRFWDGMTAGIWFRMVAKHRFDIRPGRWPMFFAVSSVAAINSVLTAIHSALYARTIRQTELAQDPVFIIGHWRSGTTLLHEYFVLDEQFTYPSTYQCFAPHHCYMTGRVIPSMLWFLMPARRPMDNVAAGWDRPQEDEFALCNLGVPSPYEMLCWPKHGPQHVEYLDLQGLTPGELSRWKDGLRYFLQVLTASTPKQIVLKSPPHTARVGTLVEMFPNARFVHIVRNPYVLYSSTVNLWKRLSEDEGMNHSNFEWLDEYVFSTMSRMYDALERDRPKLAGNRYVEIKYEELVKQPVERMREIYAQLELDGFDKVQPKLEGVVGQQKGFKTNRWELGDDKKAEIARRWQFYFERYGYEQ